MLWGQRLTAWLDLFFCFCDFRVVAAGRQRIIYINFKLYALTLSSFHHLYSCKRAVGQVCGKRMRSKHALYI